ncbi:MAG TPA: tRNA (N(6)-L-threonylcarbamoyladenosine(37)-C(2))-methylthiotransferase MtaB [Tepidimicrobium sp.]|nr:tRNA (N(6)-L-threonylcarbamoyladenosine(37)-C(2))-methylthiotransferase MtaB [Tepidimicrobium sp.]
MDRVAFYTLGCKVNQYETEAMEELFHKRGYRTVDPDEEADIYVINTCTVTNLSDRKSRQFIRRAKRINEEAIVAVVGCYSQVATQEVESIEGVDVIIGTTARNRIVDLCEEVMEDRRRINIVESLKGRRDFERLSITDIESQTRAYMKIQDGCNQYCSYCIIPYARGPIRSRPLEDIVEESKRLAEAGFKEIVLTGIHVASYGKDLKDVDLLAVVDRVAEVRGIERIRLSSMEPRMVDEEFMKRAVANGKLCDHFHLSLQSGSDKVLKRMNRRYTTGEFKNIVELIRRYMPEAGITTDIIVGFPGETKEQFEESCQFVKDIGFSRVHVFKYSPRRGTPASEFEDQIHGDVKNRRSERLISLSQEVSQSFIDRYIGQVVEVLFEEESRGNKGYMEGYTTNYIRVKAKGCHDISGEILPVKIMGKENNILIGKIEEF